MPSSIADRGSPDENNWSKTIVSFKRHFVDIDCCDSFVDCFLYRFLRILTTN
ncbi:hypothetical protein LOAG_06700 [Loa loa]|uniref:Uncharacterized protein n=1 Tax=Loa loa TaxID=7209 RepID=A0A1S0TXV1_LOALO|nr:hypothetical protein LOAG_06700 [Loa loa]EFO21785.2 hypothetical protein LOAG_06700 [Loa loa]